jgi:hypothetical protein
MGISGAGNIYIYMLYFNGLARFINSRSEPAFGPLSLQRNIDLRD